MRIEEDLKLDFSSVLIKPKRSTLKSRSEVDITRKYTFKHSERPYNGVPIIAANMDTVGTFEMATEFAKHDLMVALHKHYSVDDLKNFWEMANVANNNAFYSMGITDSDLQKYQLISNLMSKKTRPNDICIDVANGYSEPFLDFVKKFRDDYPTTTIMAGNVVTAEMTEALILAGADIVKVGIGPGSVCTTRIQTGVGYPQLSAIIECADAAHGLGGHICADGGCTVPGDVAKAFGGGADFVMLGGMLAGHDECGGELEYEFSVLRPSQVTDEWKYVKDEGQNTASYKRKKNVKFYGMSSAEAMDKHSGGVAEYRASEGKAVLVPYRGPVENTVKEILGGLRSTCTYVGASKLKELSKRTTFIRVTQQENKVFND